MIITIILIFFVITTIGAYLHGYQEGFIDGKVDEKWRVRDERRNKNIE